MPSALRAVSCACQSRRAVLRGFAAAACAGMLLPAAARAGSAQALVLTCMDYRLVDDAVKYFHGRGLADQYDHVVLAGASAGALGKLGAEWAATFWKHVETAIQLHHVKELIVVDHRDCGAFKIVFGAESIAERKRETNLHRALLRELRTQVNARFPTLRTQLLLMDLNGAVEDLSADDQLDVYRKTPAPSETDGDGHAAAVPAAAAAAH